MQFSQRLLQQAYDADPLESFVFSQLSRFQFVLFFVALVVLRLVVGLHFFKEGTDKLQSGKFTSKYFLAGAKGPMASMFTGMIEDADSSQKLCVKKDDSGKYIVDHHMTELLWNDFLNKAVDVYNFGDVELQNELAEKRSKLAETIQAARDSGDSSVDTRKLDAEYRSLERKILQLRNQREMGEEILQTHVDELISWLSQNEVELVGYFNTANRLEGFERDGKNKDEAAVYVESLRYQVDTIRSDRSKKLYGWSSQMDAFWDSYESRIQALPIEEQIKKAGVITAHRPYDETYSFYKIVDKIIPWFDTLIGISLILGLLTRVSSFLAAGFLLSVVLSQPPWIPGTDPKAILYAIEFAACLVIFATSAGRFGGLDYFLNPALYRNPDQDGQELNETAPNVA